jgi:hypothetical protein
LNKKPKDPFSSNTEVIVMAIRECGKNKWAEGFNLVYMINSLISITVIQH